MNLFFSTTGHGLARAEMQGNHRWSVDTLLEGLEISCLSLDPNQSQRVYAGTRANGVLVSNDYGRKWSELGLAGMNVKAVAASPAVPGILFAGTKPACLFVSENFGQTWRELVSFRKIFSRHFWFSPAEPPFSAYIQGIALSPTDANVIIAGIEAGAVVRSTDGGSTWADHRPGALRDCHSILFHHTNGSWVYEGGGTGAGNATSRDGGQTWVQVKRGLDCHYGWACAADPVDPQLHYFSAAPSPMKAHGDQNAQAGIFRFEPSGGWKKLGGGLPQPLKHMPYGLLTDPIRPDCVIAGLSNGDIWESPDRGDTWNQLPVNLGSIRRSLAGLTC